MAGYGLTFLTNFDFTLSLVKLQLDLVQFQLDVVLQSGAILSMNWHIAQAQNHMNFDSLLVALKLQYARPC